MAIAPWLIWRRQGIGAARAPLVLFAVQLLLNVAWSWIFFGMHQPGWALLEIDPLWCGILATIIAFFRRSSVVGWLLVPYLAWVTFAAVLNLAIWRFNGGL